MTIRAAALLLLLGLLLVVLAGCALQPKSIRAEYDHLSHLTAGPPFGPRNEEDAVDQINLLGLWNLYGLHVAAGVGYQLVDGGFFGPRCTATFRISKEFQLQ